MDMKKLKKWVIKKIVNFKKGIGIEKASNQKSMETSEDEKSMDTR